MCKKELNRVTNRHIAKTLDLLERSFPITADAKNIIKDKMHFLSRDVYDIMQENGNGNKPQR